MSEQNLKNKPLVEAILEVRWNNVAQAGSPMPFDPNYSLLLGRFSERIEKDYPIHEQLPNAQVPDVMAQFMVQHRFRKVANAWPVVQIGPGIITVNDTVAYTWETFKPLCVHTVTKLFEAYPETEKLNFKIQDITLRYLDAVKLDFGRENVFSFLKEKMKTTLDLPNNLFVETDIESKPLGFNWQTTFAHKSIGVVTLRFWTGMIQNVPSLIWETCVQTTPDKVPAIPDGFSEWVENAHTVTHNLFFKLIDGELREQFDK
jgi:uncharacterized protein (TIGR04255 family)